MNKPFKAEIQRTPLHQMKRIDELHLASEAPKGSNLIVRDSGRGSPLTDAELKASIYAKGIIQPLIWKQIEGNLYVVAGNRRLRLLREIFADATATMVSTQDVDDFGGDWREIAIDSNLSLPPHLVERYEIIVALAKDLKLQPADVQARFGMTPRQYNQVMALGKMSETVRTAWKNAEIDAKTAQAFTLEPDPKEQDRIFAAVKKSAYRGQVSDHSVKSKIVPSGQREVGRMVAFVGVEAVRKAKLIKVEDLFSNDHVVTDTKALNKLVGDKLAAKCNELVEVGWSWAIPESKIEGSSWHYGTVEPSTKDAKATPEENDRLKQLQTLIGGNDEDEEYDDEKWMDEKERIEESIKARGFTPAQRAKAGCFVKIAQDGQLIIEYGKVKPSEKKSVQSSERAATKKKAKAKKPGVVTLTNALAERLSQQLEKALSASLHATPDVAVAALIAAFASNGHVLDVEIGGEGRHAFGKNSSEKNFAQVFDGAMKSTAEARVVMLAKIAAEALSIQIRSAEAKAPIDDAGLQVMVSKMDGKLLSKTIADEFDAKNYFDSVNLQACVAAVRAGMGTGHAEKVAKMKKGEAAKFAAANVPGTGWLPKELRTCHYRGPLEAAVAPKAKPVRSVAVAKSRKPVKSLLSKKQQKAVRDQGIRAGKAAMAKAK